MGGPTAVWPSCVVPEVPVQANLASSEAFAPGASRSSMLPAEPTPSEVAKIGCTTIPVGTEKAVSVGDRVDVLL